MSTPATSAAASSGPDARDDWDLAAVIAAELGKPKPWWQSRGMWGAFMVLVAQVARGFGLEIDSAALTDAVLSGITLLGLGLAWWGRVKATRPISLRDVAPGLHLGAADAPAPDSLRTPARPARPEGLPSDPERDSAGYWSRDRGPFGGAD